MTATPDSSKAVRAGHRCGRHLEEVRGGGTRGQRRSGSAETRQGHSLVTHSWGPIVQDKLACAIQADEQRRAQRVRTSCIYRPTWGRSRGQAVAQSQLGQAHVQGCARAGAACHRHLDKLPVPRIPGYNGSTTSHQALRRCLPRHPPPPAPAAVPGAASWRSPPAPCWL